MALLDIKKVNLYMSRVSVKAWVSMELDFAKHLEFGWILRRIMYCWFGGDVTWDLMIVPCLIYCLLGEVRDDDNYGLFNMGSRRKRIKERKEKVDRKSVV